MSNSKYFTAFKQALEKDRAKALTIYALEAWHNQRIKSSLRIKPNSLKFRRFTPKGERIELSMHVNLDRNTPILYIVYGTCMI
jgi:hypothetical protein